MNFSIQEISQALEKYIYELETEVRLNWVGKKDNLNTHEITQKYGYLWNGDVLGVVKEKLNNCNSREKEYEELKRIYCEVVDGILHLKISKLEDQFESGLSDTVIKLGDSKLPYYGLLQFLKTEKDYAKREEAYFSLEKSLITINSLKEDIINNECDQLIEMTGMNYLEYCQFRKGYQIEKLMGQLEMAHSRLKPLYLSVMNSLSNQKLQRDFKEILACHRLFLFHPDSIRSSIKSSQVFSIGKSILECMNLDVSAGGRIKFDLEDREKKNSRAVCFSPQVPDEVHLIIKPQDDLDSFGAFFHEMGHCQHFANSESELPFALRGLGTSHALTEVYAYIFESISLEPIFLTEWLKLSEKEANLLQRDQLALDLSMLFRYIGKLFAEYEFYSSSLKEGFYGKTDCYARHLSEKTGFIYKPIGFFTDLDRFFYCADYLRAWIVHAQLKHYLNYNYGENWFENPKVGKFFLELWKTGNSMSVDELSSKLGYDPFDTYFLEKKFEPLYDLF